MPITFNDSQWSTVRENYQRWWRGELGRPLFNICVTGGEPDRPEPPTEPCRRMAQYGDGVSPEAIIDRLDWNLSRIDFVADSFPAVFTDFGAGVVAAFLGCRAQVDENTVWFHAPDQREISEMRFEFTLEHPWIERIAEIYAAAHRRWGGLVQMSMPDLGGALDVLSSFRPGEKLLLDLYDHPEEVLRTTWEIHDCWWRYYEYFEGLLAGFNPGYTAWTPIYSAARYYMLQCDFCYMISPEMFDRFVKPELAACCGKLANAFYHLDGPGELPHLDSLLTIESLKGVQWIPGSGSPAIDQWPEVYRKIKAAGKLAQLHVGPTATSSGLEVIDRIAEQTGDVSNCIFIGSVPRRYADELDDLLTRYGAK